MAGFTEDHSELPKTLRALEEDTPVRLTPERAAAVLQYFGRDPSELSMRIASRLLGFDEGLIRARCVKLWLCINRSDDENFLDRIFADGHPSVAVAAFCGAAKGWPNFDSERTYRLISGLAEMAKKEHLAIALFDELLAFENPDYGSDVPPELFKSLVLPILRSIHNPGFIKTAEFWFAMKEGFHLLGPTEKLDLLKEWTRLIERAVSALQAPDDYFLAVIDLIFVLEESFYEEREELIRRLLGSTSTGVTFYTLAQMVDKWKELTGKERQLVHDLLRELREDRIWLEAVVLTRRDIPGELLETVASIDSLSGEVDSVEEAIGVALFGACLCVYCGEPAALWRYGGHYTDNADWARFRREVACSPQHPWFELCLECITGRGTGGDEFLAEALRKTDTSDYEKYFDFMLKFELTYEGVSLKSSWAILFEQGSADQRSEWIGRMAEMATGVLDTLFDLKYWIIDDHISLALYSYLPGDVAICAMLSKFDKGALSSDRFLLTARSLVESVPPKLHETYGYLKTWLLRNAPREEELINRIELLRLETIDERSRLRREEGLKEPELHSWVFP